jgi:hypothetical protein
MSECKRTLTWAALALFVCALSPIARATRIAPATLVQRRADVEVTASLSEAVVKLGAALQLNVRVDGRVAAARVVSLPTVEGLSIGPVGSPSSHQTVQIINGRRQVSRSMRWAIPVRPQELGDFTITGVGIEIDGTRYVTDEQQLRVVPDMQGDDLGSFEFDHPERVYEGEPFTLTMTFGWDAAINDQVNYANLSLPWLGQLPGTLALGSKTKGLARTIEINLNSRQRVEVESLGTTEIDGRKMRLLRLQKRYAAGRPGTLDFPTSHLEFGSVRERGFFRDREVAKSFYKRAPGFSIEVLELPEEGRPFDFTGAVGRFDVVADVDRREVDAGESIKLTVEWTGEANLEFFDPPDPSRIPGFEDFRVYGQTDRKSFDRRTVIYDIAPISDIVTEIPPLPLSVFDTEEEGYTLVTTRSIPIRVHALAGSSGNDAEAGRERVELDILDIQTGSSGAEGTMRPGAKTTLAGLFGLPLAWLGLRTLVRRRGDPASREARLRRGARKRLARELGAAQRACDEASALLRFLAARTGEAEQAWLGRDVIEHLAGERSGEGPDEDADKDSVPSLSTEDARALEALLARLDERTWAGDDKPVGSQEILSVADRLMKGGL